VDNVGVVQMLDSEEAARRLGVKVQTLYSYVSRGQISAHRGRDGRRVAFRADEIDDRARRLRGPSHSEFRVTPITTEVSRLTAEGPSYRGHPAVSLAGDTRFEDVADLLWVTDPGPWHPRPDIVAMTARFKLAARDRLRLAVVFAGAHDPMRADLRPEAVVRAGRSLIATMIASLPGPDDGRCRADDDRLLAARLAERLGASQVTDELLDAVNAILVVQADHELAPSTLAVRVAATTRADAYDALLSGLGAISGAVHGGAADYVRRLLDSAQRTGVDRALGEALRWQGSLPGFGHVDYDEGDPRFGPLMGFFERLADADVRALVGDVLARAEAQHLPHPNVDFAIGAITFAASLAPDAGETLITVSRMAGWIAHYLEEIQETPRHIRARSVYADQS
jgi:citrate synthase